MFLTFNHTRIHWTITVCITIVYLGIAVVFFGLLSLPWLGIALTIAAACVGSFLGMCIAEKLKAS